MTRSILAFAALCSGLNTVRAASPDEAKFFEEKIRPILVAKCQACHGAEKQKGGLRLDSPDMLLAGGDSGPAVVPHKPEESLLVDAILYKSVEMPPDEKLPAEEIELLTTWVKLGAPWPDHADTRGTLRGKQEKITDADRAYWAFQPLKSVVLPEVADAGWSRNGVDRFIWQKLAAEGLNPSPPAERGALIRRLAFDLVGLPPTPEEVAEFVNDPAPDAYEQLVERLLNSPRYGERWARHWLDLVRYAESDGFKQDDYRPHAWRYRDYVIRAFNEDKPYDRFVREQIAGDELAPYDLDALAATAYLRHWIYEYNQRDVRTQWSNILNDVTDVTGEVFLGVSIGCARCHDHKFDPILRKDYFRLQAFFAPLLPRDDLPFADESTTQSYREKLAAWEQKTADLRRQLAEMERPFREKTAEGAINKFPPDIRPMMQKSPPERDPFEHQLAELAFRQVAAEYSKLDVGAKLKGEAKTKWESLKKQLAEFDREKPQMPEPAFTVSDVGPLAPVTFIPSDRTRQDIKPGFLTVLDPAEAAIQPISSQSTGRRSALAQWITRPENPLATRVIVNRVWQYHFGSGIVPTSSDFGRMGDAPTHPELLDWLAAQFLREGWSLKELHRLLVCSATYRQAAISPTSEAGRLKDPENHWLWHMPIRRLDAEQIRDASLAVTGELFLPPGGPAVDLARPYRTVYTKVVRNQRDPLLDVFDAPDNFNSTSSRNTTTTPTQSLLMINGNWMLDRATAFARRLSRAVPDDPAERVALAFALAYGRAPSAAQQQSAVQFLNRTTTPASPPATSPGFAPFPGRSGQALEINPATGLVPVVEAGAPLPVGAEFTVEAFVLLRSLYEDAAVRAIAAQWDGDTKHAGWSLGVTSTKSKYDPRNLILQLVGEGKEGQVYEVLPSNLRLELNRPYYVAVTVRLKDPTDKGVTFYLQDLSEPNRPLQTATVPHKVLDQVSGHFPLMIGGRSGPERQRWDGLLDDVRITPAALPPNQLLPHGTADNVAGWWRFESDTGVLHDATSHHRDLTAVSPTASPPPSLPVALVDFCHVLLNSSEFLYVE